MKRRTAARSYALGCADVMPGDSGTSDPWWLYVLLCANDRLYIGIAKDVDLRFEIHRSGKGAFYTRLNAPLRILARQPQPSRSAALKAEYALKRQTRLQKLSWVASIAGPVGTNAAASAKLRPMRHARHPHRNDRQ